MLELIWWDASRKVHVLEFYDPDCYLLRPIIESLKSCNFEIRFRWYPELTKEQGSTDNQP